MKCPKCSNKMVELFTSWACDHCDGKTSETGPGSLVWKTGQLAGKLAPIGKSGWLGDTTSRPWPSPQLDDIKYKPGLYKPQFHQDWHKTPGEYTVELMSVRMGVTKKGYTAVFFEVCNTESRMVYALYRAVIHDRGYGFAHYCVQDINHILDAFGQYDFHQHAEPRKFETNRPIAKMTVVEKTHRTKGFSYKTQRFSKV